MNNWIVAIGASAGGVEAIQRLTEALPLNFKAPILVVLHFPENAQSKLPQILARRSLLPALHPRNGEEMVSGRIYIAPPSRHMTVEGAVIRLTDGPKENGHRPAIDPTFRSVAEQYGPASIGVVLSGLLDDGSAGVTAIRLCGGVCMAQDLDEAAFADMPRNAIAAADIKNIYGINEMAKRLTELTNSPPPESTPCKDPMPSGRLTPEQVNALEAEGKATQFTCPECGGALYDLEKEAGSLRCRVGHAFSLQTLEAEQAKNVEDAMWTALRALEENASLNERLMRKTSDRGMTASASNFEHRAKEQRRLAAVIRDVLLPTSEEHPYTSSSLAS